MNEADLSQALNETCRKVMPFSQVLKHADRFNVAYPDTTVTWHKPTSWWEVKFYNQRMFTHRPGQKTKCEQLAEQGICYYVIYEARKATQRTLIVEPKNVEHWEESTLTVPGFNHLWVAQFIRQVHESLR